jgi:hypothetical protein
MKKAREKLSSSHHELLIAFARSSVGQVFISTAAEIPCNDPDKMAM